MTTYNYTHRVRDPKTGEATTVLLQLKIDPDAIARRMAARVVRSKTKRGQYMHGAVTLRVVT